MVPFPFPLGTRSRRIPPCFTLPQLFALRSAVHALSLSSRCRRGAGVPDTRRFYACWGGGDRGICFFVAAAFRPACVTSHAPFSIAGPQPQIAASHTRNTFEITDTELKLLSASPI